MNVNTRTHMLIKSQVGKKILLTLNQNSFAVNPKPVSLTCNFWFAELLVGFTKMDKVNLGKNKILVGSHSHETALQRDWWPVFICFGSPATI